MPSSPQEPRPSRIRTTPSQRLWRPDLRSLPGPTYRAIADAMEIDIAAGRLASGARLPSQRALARALGVNLTTITRAMREAERRGLIIGAAGSGTFVASRLDRVPEWSKQDQIQVRADFVDLSLNYPPDVTEAELGQALAEWTAAIARRPQECRSLLPYRTTQGAPANRAAAGAWIGERGLDVDPNRIILTSGAQHGLALSLAALVRPGDAVLCEALAYPGLRAVAATTGIRLIPLAIDGEGLRPAALREAIRQHTARALVCSPTLHNPTGAIASLERRQELVRVLRRTDLWVIEDDLYAALVEDAPPPLAALHPERTVYVTSLSKTVAPGLRVGYVVAPNAAVLESMLVALRASTWMTAPILTAIASAWIQGGVARRALRRVRSEIARRQRVMQQTLLPALGDAVDRTSALRAPHLWVRLASASAEAHVIALLGQRGVGVMTGEAFRVGAGVTAPYGFRVCLGAARSIEALTAALSIIGDAFERGETDPGRA